MEKLVLFDIDGTILMTAGVGRRAIRRALLEAMGLAGPIDGVRFDGKTDPQIVRELLEAADHPDADDPERVWEVCRQYVRLLEAELAGADGSVRVLDGVGELLRVLEGRADKEVYFRADKDIAYGIVVQVMSEIKGAGVEKLGMVTVPMDSDIENRKQRTIS